MLVSICLPVFNGEQYLADAISSVLNQTHEQIELLISDDHSTDGSWQIIQQFSERDQRIKLCRNEERRGLFENYNSTIRGANGEFIKLFAQDDLLSPNAVAVMLEALDENKSVSLVACGKTILAEAPPHSAQGSCKQQREVEGAREPSQMGVVEESSDWKADKHESALTNGFNPGKFVILKCLRQYRNLVGEPVAVMLRRSLAGAGFSTEYKSLGDMEFWFRLLEKGDLFYISEKLVTFRQHPESRTSHLLSDLDWLLDFPKLSKQYKHYLDDLGIDRSAYCSRFLELAAPLVKECASEDKAFIDSLPPYKELAYYLLKRLPQALDGEANYNSVLNSTSWKVTKPLRLLKGKLEK